MNSLCQIKSFVNSTSPSAFIIFSTQHGHLKIWGEVYFMMEDFVLPLVYNRSKLSWRIGRIHSNPIFWLFQTQFAWFNISWKPFSQKRAFENLIFVENFGFSFHISKHSLLIVRFIRAPNIQLSKISNIWQSFSELPLTHNVAWQNLWFLHVAVQSELVIRHKASLLFGRERPCTPADAVAFLVRFTSWKNYVLFFLGNSSLSAAQAPSPPGVSRFAWGKHQDWWPRACCALLWEMFLSPKDFRKKHRWSKAAQGVCWFSTSLFVGHGAVHGPQSTRLGVTSQTLSLAWSFIILITKTLYAIIFLRL